MLEIGVHRDDDLAPRRGQARLERRRLAEVPPELDDAEPGLGPDERPRQREAAVRAAIVHEHEFEGVARLEQRRRARDPRDELDQRGGLVVDRGHDGDERCHEAAGVRPVTVQL